MKKWKKLGIGMTMIVVCIAGNGIYYGIENYNGQQFETASTKNETGKQGSITQVTEQTATEVITSERNTTEDAMAKVLEERRKNPLLLLVNKDHALPADYEVSLATLNDGHQVAEVIYDDLMDMLSAAKEAGCSVVVASAYRTEQQQEQLLKQEIRKNMWNGMNEEEAEADALLTVAPYGYSEHETGYTVDLVDANNQMLDDTQETTTANIWLRRNCWKYGFVMRYPRGKEDITGYSYESWHFRYVGKADAKEMTEERVTLEEYLNTLTQRK